MLEKEFFLYYQVFISTVEILGAPEIRFIPHFPFQREDNI